MTVRIGFDVGQSLGWSVIEEDELVSYGVLSMPRHDPQKCIELLENLMRVWEPDEVAVEDVKFSKYRDAHASYWRIRTLLELVVSRKGLYSTMKLVPTNTLKEWATGNGNASKSLMCRAARKRWDVPLYAVADLHLVPGTTKAELKRQEDQADAILVATWALTG